MDLKKLRENKSQVDADNRNNNGSVRSSNGNGSVQSHLKPEEYNYKYNISGAVQDLDTNKAKIKDGKWQLKSTTVNDDDNIDTPAQQKVEFLDENGEPQAYQG